MDQPIILCGLGRVGQRVLEYLHTAGMPAVVIDNQCAPDDPRLQGSRLIRGDCRQRQVMIDAGVEHSRGVLVLTSNDLVNITTALLVRELHPEVRVVMRMFNQNLIARLGQAVHHVYALSTSLLTAPLIALTALTGQALGSFRIEGLPESRRQVAEVKVEPGSSLLGQSIAEIDRQGQAVAYFPVDAKARWLNEVDPQARLSVGDRLVLCGEPRKMAPLFAEDGDASVLDVLWAGWIRRQGRALRRTLGEMDKAVKICTGILLFVIAGSTLIFALSVRKYGVADALFRTVSVMATGSDMHEEHLDAPWQKVFAAMLRILGAALTAAFTAIVTNYLLRARLGGALEIRRIPDGGHVVVCGLSGVGYRVIEELLASGERVVAVEQAPDNRFVTTVRRLGVPVVIGDARVIEVLRQAHVGQARAVVAATTEELYNLEIALLARELNPRQRVVLRLADPDLAKMLREAANIRLALSTSTLAAPAFVAMLFGDRVLSVFLLEGRLLAALDLLIGDQDSVLVDQTVRAIAVDYRVLPLAVLRTAAGKSVEVPLQTRLAKGDRLIALIALADLQRLMKRESPPRDCSVEVAAFPVPARDWLVTLLGTQQNISHEEATEHLKTLPMSLGTGLTQGQAEDLLARLYRERVAATLKKG